jgi:hypothetical protein
MEQKYKNNAPNEREYYDFQNFYNSYYAAATNLIHDHVDEYNQWHIMLYSYLASKKIRNYEIHDICLTISEAANHCFIKSPKLLERSLNFLHEKGLLAIEPLLIEGAYTIIITPPPLPNQWIDRLCDDKQLIINN